MAVCINIADIAEAAKTDTNSSQNLRCDEAQPARTKALQSTSRFRCVAESVTAGTTQEIHHQYASAAPPPVPVYRDNDVTSMRSEDPADEEVLHHQYPSAAPPPVPVYHGNDVTPAQETARHPAGTGAAELPTSQTDNTEPGDEDLPYGIAAANGVYQTTDENHSLSSVNPALIYGPSITNDIETDPNSTGNTLYEQQSHCILYGRSPAAEQ
ncbi:zinc ion binding [Branchiostoma belcheri]|nr:zinc ion binding [Branchiostoma belcheri]